MIVKKEEVQNALEDGNLSIEDLLDIIHEDFHLSKGKYSKGKQEMLQHALKDVWEIYNNL